jgi:TrmH family RNA methyltransferase
MTNAQIKFIQALARQKYRKEHKAFIIEGSKSAKEWLDSEASIRQVIAVPEWLSENESLLKRHPKAEIIVAAGFELSRISLLSQAGEVLLVVDIPEEQALTIPGNSWSLYLEQIQDPGNMGTIIRIADWFGIGRVLLSEGCVEIYNPKVVQATMGSLLRVHIHQIAATSLPGLLRDKNQVLYATSLHGDNLFTRKGRLQPGIIAMGNESRGLSDLVLQLATCQIRIPRLGGAESLNVGVATGIVCATLVHAAQEDIDAD